jgi:hypothetical protein
MRTPGSIVGILHGTFFEGVGLRHDFILAGGTCYPHMWDTHVVG